ncbi:hypothetical protein AYJ54_34545 [Bradyrhizobium centrolobii]|uniref:Uncharacterized protein n=1 Tax=Bradyrhizobium centrolobii TaxID=1505087 RepID=A0A176Y7Z4_9BRAD|nr:hypothetical protein [Bradyrhizobium centrolobii]OAE97662.1 hypothetical protein AYJ54_34545 [Bradyrhizobium centrolobii]
MKWPQWYPTRADIIGISIALAVACIFVFVVVGFPNFHQATGFGPDWDCKAMPKGDPVCVKKPGQ